MAGAGGDSRSGSYLFGSLGCGALKFPQATSFLASHCWDPGTSLLRLLQTLTSNVLEQKPLEGPLALVPSPVRNSGQRHPGVRVMHEWQQSRTQEAEPGPLRKKYGDCVWWLSAFAP